MKRDTSYKVIICGDRYWADYRAVKREVDKLPPGTVVIEGGARGADRLARQAAAARGLEVRTFDADWARYGRAAGPIRNAAMLAAGPALVLAFHADLDKSKGTRDMVKRARRAGVPVKLYKS